MHVWMRDQRARTPRMLTNEALVDAQASDKSIAERIDENPLVNTPPGFDLTKHKDEKRDQRGSAFDPHHRVARQCVLLAMPVIFGRAHVALWCESKAAADATHRLDRAPPVVQPPARP